ncbi:BTAD domain-containing putative transcriptional regulator [Pilimelia columellifera]|uniref:OmpR/PhoB-type domain-containing protein n=1 Tax=Pilimelia columellifera subsp. columellifera TaxID=706583 RepID=A0ABN3NCI3_9ACTN
MRVQVLGRLSAYDHAGRALAVEDLPRRARQVLSVLAARHDRPQSKDALADAVWGEDLPGNHVAALEHYVSLIRRTLEPGQPTSASFIVTRSAGYLFATERASLDLALLRTLAREAETQPPGGQQRLACRRQILDLATDLPFLDDEYADWAAGVRGEVRDHLLGSLRELAEAALDGEPARALRLAQDAIAMDPYSEQPYRVAMRAAAALERTDDALRWFDRCRQALATELDVTPSAETVALRDQIRARRGDGQSRPTLAARPAEAPDPDFIGRQTELELILGDRTTPVVHLVGPIGAGKSALLAAVAARRPGRVGVGRGPGPDSPDSLRLAWLRSALGAIDAGAAARDVVDAAMAQRRGLTVDELERVATALTGSGPLVLAVDDAADLDPDSVTELSWLRHQVPELRLVLAYRYPSALAGRPVANLGADVVLRLSPLTAADLAGTDGLWERTGGVPALVGAAGHPPAVAESVALHVARVRTRPLPPAAWELLRLTAILGPLSIGELRELASLPLPEILAAVDHLAHAHLLVESPEGPVSHRASLVGQAIAAQVSAAHAAHLAERLAVIRGRAGAAAGPAGTLTGPTRRRRSPAVEGRNVSSPA